MTTRCFTTACVALLLSLVGAGSMRSLSRVSAQAAPAQGAAVEKPVDAAADQAMLDAVCGACHESNLVAGAFRTPAEWDDTIGRMQSYGAGATPEQFDQVRTHLLRTYGKASVNAAPAKDLAPVLDITAAVAEAVVTYRTQNGKFMTLDDLKKVPGLDAAKVDTRKARLTF